MWSLPAAIFCPIVLHKAPPFFSEAGNKKCLAKICQAFVRCFLNTIKAYLNNGDKAIGGVLPFSFLIN
jgi:hypothetical protein